MVTRAAAREVLAENRRDGYTIPSPKLYPYQWNWDSAFVALGLASADPAAAKAEVESLLSARWENGMVPQIVFWDEDAEGYFPGPEEWDCRTPVAATSGLTQPPIVATAARHVAETTGDGAFRDRVLDSLDAYLSWWRRERSADGRVVYVRHPWETGMDDSPAWVPVLEAFAPDAVEYERADVADESLADERPTDWDYDRYVALYRQARSLDYDETALREASPFVVEDALTNAIYARACADLAVLYEDAGDDRAAEWRRQAETTRAGMRERLWSDEVGTFVSHDRRRDRPLLANSVAGLAALYGGVPDADQRARLLETFDDEFAGYRFAVPTYVGPEMDYDRYWRGPVWLNTNWLVETGLRTAGYDERADRVREDSLSLLERNGFQEYFNPETGEGRGSDQFSWSAALYLEWTADDRFSIP